MTTIRTTFGGTPRDLRKRDRGTGVPLATGRGFARGGTEPVTSDRQSSAVISHRVEETLMNPIQIPAEWDDNAILMFEEFCAFIRTPQRTVRDWKRRGMGPRWWKFNGTGRLYTTVAELRRFLAVGWQRPMPVE